MRLAVDRISLAFLLFLFPVAMLQAVDQPFHDAPASAKAQKNPLEGQAAAIDAGKVLYARNCLSCHGKAGKGTGNVPSLVDGKLKGVTEGEVFWFITKGSKDNGMPSWAFLPEQKRWQIVYLCGSDGLGQGACGGVERGSSRRGRGSEGEGRTSECAVYRLSLRDAGHYPQDYGERPAAAVRH